MEHNVSILITVYNAIKKIKRNLNRSDFYDYIIPNCLPNNIVKNDIDIKTKQKYIRTYMPKHLIEYYRDRKNQQTIQNHLTKWSNDLDSDRESVRSSILNVLTNEDKKTFSDFFEKAKKTQNVLKIDSEFYYFLFRYCIVGDLDVNCNDNYDNLQEFNEEILEKYGVSGKTGRTVILQLAEMGSTTNPYIYFEAAEIEYMRRYDRVSGEDCIKKAYLFYLKASQLGLAIADWSLGYMAQMSNNKSWRINEFAYLSKKEKIEIAIEYYKKAAEKKCSKAYNSLGNIVKEVNNDIKRKHSLKTSLEYYKLSAEHNDIFGMYNYASELEKSIIANLDSSAEITLSQQQEIINNGKTMLKYYERAARLGYSKACYCCALYYGHLLDMDNSIRRLKYFEVEEDKQLAINYLQDAVKLNELYVCYDAYLYLIYYIVNHGELFASIEYEKRKAREYIDFLTDKLLKTNKATEKQKDLIKELQKKLYEMSRDDIRKRQFVD